MRKFGMIAALLPLAACASYPPVMNAVPPPPAMPSKTVQVDQSLAQAAKLQTLYATGYKDSAKALDMSQLPIIGAAAVAAWVLLVDNPNAAKWVGKIGIGAGAYAAGRGQLIASGLPDFYLAGHTALTCVIGKGSDFSGTGAEARYKGVEAALTSVGEAIQDLSDAKLAEPRALGNRGDALRQARIVADAAIEQAGTARRAAWTEQREYDRAGSVFSAAVAAISVRVASKGRLRAPVDYASARDSFGPPPMAAAGAQGLASDVNFIISDIQANTTALQAKTLELTAVTRPYAQRLQEVAACPDQIK